MSSERRPWYKWYPKDFGMDEKVQSLSPIAELVYRRLLDIMWQSNACRLLNVCLKLAYTVGRGLPQDIFENAWLEIQTPGFELFKITEDGKWIYSKRLSEQMEVLEKRTISGRKGGIASVKQRASKIEAKSKQTGKQRATDTEAEADTKERYKEKKIKLGEFKNVSLSENEIKKLNETFGESVTQSQIENLSTYIESKGKRYKSHYATILSWNRKDNKTPKPKMVPL